MRHPDVWHRIPWFVNGRMDETERERIEAHLRSCEECRHEVEAQRQVMNAIAGDTRIDCVPGVSFQRLWERIAAQDRSPVREVPAPTNKRMAIESPGALRIANTADLREGRLPSNTLVARQVRTRNVTRWLVAAVIVEAVGITALGAMLTSRGGGGESLAAYRTVTSPAPSAPEGIIRAVFSPTLSVSELQKLLEQSGLEIVAGPTEAGVYTLAATASTQPARVEASLMRLRADPAVRFAEPVEAAAGGSAAHDASAAMSRDAAK